MKTFSPQNVTNDIKNLLKGDKVKGDFKVKFNTSTLGFFHSDGIEDTHVEGTPYEDEKDFDFIMMKEDEDGKFLECKKDDNKELIRIGDVIQVMEIVEEDK